MSTSARTTLGLIFIISANLAAQAGTPSANLSSRILVGAASPLLKNSCAALAQFNERERQAWEEIQKEKSSEPSQEPPHLIPPSELFKSLPFSKQPLHIVTFDQEIYLHELAFKVAAGVYDLPAVETLQKGSEFVEQLKTFNRGIPSGFRLYYASVVASTGLKYAILQPMFDPSLPWLFTIAGTETLLDWFSNAELGKSQMASLQRFTGVLTQCLFFDSDHHPLPDRKLILTGHSLGGGLAQAFAYLLQLEREGSGLRNRALSLITWNAFGGIGLISQIGKYDMTVAARMDTANYFMAGEPISQFSRHFGRTFELPHPRTLRLSKLIDRRALQLHSIETIARLIHDPSEGSLSDRQEKAPPFGKELNRIREALSVFGHAQSLFFYSEEVRVIDKLRDSLKVITENSLKDPDTYLAFHLLKNVCQEVSVNAHDDGHGFYADFLDQDLKRARALFD